MWKFIFIPSLGPLLVVVSPALAFQFILGALVAAAVDAHLSGELAFNPLALPEALFVQSPRLFVVGTLALYVDTLLIIPNQNLFRVANEKTTFAAAFAMADQVLYSGVASITELMTKEGLINLDFADVRAIMSEMGKAMMGTGEATGEKRAIEAAEARLREATAAAEFANDNARRMRTESENGGIAEIDALRAASDASKLLAQRDALSAETRKLGLDAETLGALASGRS